LSAAARDGGEVEPERAETENDMALRILNTAIEVVRSMKDTVNLVAQHGADLARQMRRALTSIPLNIAEGERRWNGNGRQRFETAMGSANEVVACLRVADAMGYVVVDAKLLDALDKIARTLRRLA
jgi:four helix bundle protein